MKVSRHPRPTRHFFHYRHKDDLLHGVGEEDGVCGGGDLRKNTVVFEHGCCVF